MTTHTPTPPAGREHHGRRTWSTRRVAGAAAGGFLAVSAFQVAAALGAPVGPAAFGGAHDGVLPAELRVVSAVAAGAWGLAAFHALTAGGVVRRSPRLADRRISWGLAGVTTVGALMNAASSSPWERFGWAPYTAGLAVLCAVLARRGRAA